PASSLNVDDQRLEEALRAFVSAASASNAFTVTAARAPASREFIDRWQDLKKLYVILLLNEKNHGKRLAHIAEELKKVYDAYSEDFKEAFDIFFFYQANSPGTGRTNPERHVVDNLKIQDPRNRPKKKAHPAALVPYADEFA